MHTAVMHCYLPHCLYTFISQHDIVPKQQMTYPAGASIDGRSPIIVAIWQGSVQCCLLSPPAALLPVVYGCNRGSDYSISGEHHLFLPPAMKLNQGPDELMIRLDIT